MLQCPVGSQLKADAKSLMEEYNGAAITAAADQARAEAEEEQKQRELEALLKKQKAADRRAREAVCSSFGPRGLLWHCQAVIPMATH